MKSESDEPWRPEMVILFWFFSLSRTGWRLRKLSSRFLFSMVLDISRSENQVVDIGTSGDQVVEIR
jgi:hypothetical protein